MIFLSCLEICLWHCNPSNFTYSAADTFRVVLGQLHEVLCLQIWLTSFLLTYSIIFSDPVHVNSITEIRADVLTSHILWQALSELFSVNYMKFHVFKFDSRHYIFLKSSSIFSEKVHVSSLTKIWVDLQRHHNFQLASKPESPIPSEW